MNKYLFSQIFFLATIIIANAQTTCNTACSMSSVTATKNQNQLVSFACLNSLQNTYVPNTTTYFKDLVSGGFALYPNTSSYYMIDGANVYKYNGQTVKLFRQPGAIQQYASPRVFVIDEACNVLCSWYIQFGFLVPTNPVQYSTCNPDFLSNSVQMNNVTMRTISGKLCSIVYAGAYVIGTTYQPYNSCDYPGTTYAQYKVMVYSSSAKTNLIASQVLNTSNNFSFSLPSGKYYLELANVSNDQPVVFNLGTSASGFPTTVDITNADVNLLWSTTTYLP